MGNSFELTTNMVPLGDQPKAIERLCVNLQSGVSDQVLLGVTGSGKTFTMAQVVAKMDRPTLVVAPNKTLAAQLYNEFKELFPNNAVEYFVSYYDYYQPEAYLPSSDTYIEKDSSINEDIDKLRHSATQALLTRRDVLIVASVSCIYGLGSPKFYQEMVVMVQRGQCLSRDQFLSRLVEIQYQRNDYDLKRGTFRVRGDVVELIPAYRHQLALRVEFFGEEIEALFETDPLTGEVLMGLDKAMIFPGSHYISDRDNLRRAVADIRQELRGRLDWFKSKGKLVEAQRLEQRTQLDLEMIEEFGYCSGIENYSRHLDGRGPGSAPFCLLDYFASDFLVFLDESHVAVPQIGGMFNGDRSRKQTLVDFGFRLPSALDNRPLSFGEFLERLNQTVYVSATPGDWEVARASNTVIEQVNRPTGLVDPEIELRPTHGQMDDLLRECFLTMQKNERVLITTLTKRLAEDLTDYLQSRGVPTRYMHSDIGTLERVAIIQSLRQGEFYCLVGINLLREGLDLPEVSLVAILDADKEGFLRSQRSLIQTFGRAARHLRGRVLLYADKETPAITRAQGESQRRRSLQQAFNIKHNITPQGIKKEPGHALAEVQGHKVPGLFEGVSEYGRDPKELQEAIYRLEREMRQAAKELDFERAASLRDEANRLRQVAVELG